MGRLKRKYPLKLSRKDYTRLEIATVRAMLGNKKRVKLVFSYWAQLPDDFPRKYQWQRLGDIQEFLVKPKDLLYWINSKVPESITPEKIWAAQGKFWEFYKELEA